MKNYRPREWLSSTFDQNFGMKPLICSMADYYVPFTLAHMGSDECISACESAQMKNKCIYIVDIHLDSCVIIQAALCECCGPNVSMCQLFYLP